MGCLRQEMKNRFDLMILLLLPATVLACIWLIPGWESAYGMSQWEELYASGCNALAQGNFKRAQMLLQKCLEQLNYAPAANWRRAMTLKMLGSAFAANNNLDASKDFYLKALNAAQLVGGNNLNGDYHQELDLEVANTKIDLASVYRKQDKMNEAKPLYIEAITTIKKALSPDANGRKDLFAAQQLVKAEYGLAEICSRGGKIDEALSWYEEAILTGNTAKCDSLFMADLAKSYEELLKQHNLKPLNLQVAGLIDAKYQIQLAETTFTAGNYEKAESIYKEALSQLSKTPSESVQKENMQLALAEVYVKERKYAASREVWENVIEARSRAAGADSLGTDKLETKLIDSYLGGQQFYPEAEKWLRRQLKFRQQEYGSSSEQTAETLALLTYVLMLEQKDKEAKLKGAEAYELFKAQKASRRRFAASAQKLALSLAILGEFEAAASIYESVVSIWESKSLRQPLVVALTLEMQNCYEKSGNKSRAAQCKEKALKIIQGFSDDERILLAMALTDIAGVYEKRNGTVEAASRIKTACLLCSESKTADPTMELFLLQLRTKCKNGKLKSDASKGRLL